MKRKKKVSNQPSRVVLNLGSGLYRMDQVITLPGVETGYDVMGDFWSIGFVRIISGKATFLTDNREIEPPSKLFGIYLPKRSFIQVQGRHLKSVNSALFSRLPELAEAPKYPVLFPWTEAKFPTSLTEVTTLLEKSSQFRNISKCSSPHFLSRRLKAELENGYDKAISLEKLASKFKTTPAQLSRYFKRDFGMTPAKFRTWLRVFESTRRILESEAIVDAALHAGFGDLSRFYRQFSRILDITPGAMLRKGQKTPRRARTTL